MTKSFEDIKKMVEFMKLNHVKHLVYNGVEIELSHTALMGEASHEPDRQIPGKDKAPKKEQDPIFGREEGEEDVSEEILFYSS